MHLTESPVKISLNGHSTAGTGPDLTGYPHLTHAPAQWGEGVRIARNGAAVAGIALDAAAIVAGLDALASSEGITLDELFDALRYARANGAV